MTEPIPSVPRAEEPALGGTASRFVRLAFYGQAVFLPILLFVGVPWRIEAGVLGGSDLDGILFVSIVSGVLSYFSFISFVGWTWRMRKNLEKLRVGELLYAPFWTIVGYLVPILNLIRPYQVMQEIVQASQPQDDFSDWTAWKKNSGSLLVTVWWLLSLSSMLAGVLMNTMSFGRLFISPQMIEVWLFSNGLSLATTFLMTRIVLQVERWQGERWAAVRALPPVQETLALPPVPEVQEPPPALEETRPREPWGTLQELSPAPEEKTLPPLLPLPPQARPDESFSPVLQGVIALVLGALTLIFVTVMTSPDLSLGCSAVALALVGLVMALVFRAPLSSVLAFKPVPRAVWGATVLLGFGSFLLWEGAIARLVDLRFADFSLWHLLIDPFRRFGSGGMLLIFGLVFPFAEELLFRGIILPSFLPKWHPLKAILVTAILCAVLHVHPAAVLAAALLGTACGFSRVLTGSLWPAVAIHAVHNVALVLLGIDGWGLVRGTPATALLGLLFWGLGLWRLLRATDGLRLPALDTWIEWPKPPRESRTNGRFQRARLLTGATFVAALLMSAYSLFLIRGRLADPVAGVFEIGLQLALAWAAFRGSRAAALAPLVLLLARLGLHWSGLGPVLGFGVGLLLFLYGLGAVGVFVQHRCLR